MFFKPQFLVVPFIALLCQRRGRALLIGALLLAGLSILSFVLVGTDGLREYFSLLNFYGTTESGFGSYPSDMHNLRALAQYWLAFKYAPYLWIALGLPVALLIVPNALVLRLRSESPSILVRFGLVALGVLPTLTFLLGNHVPPPMPLVLLAGFVWSAHAALRRTHLHGLRATFQ